VISLAPDEDGMSLETFSGLCSLNVEERSVRLREKGMVSKKAYRRTVSEVHKPKEKS
jgi:hypothetical protein